MGPDTATMKGDVPLRSLFVTCPYARCGIGCERRGVGSGGGLMEDEGVAVEMAAANANAEDCCNGLLLILAWLEQ